MPAPTKIINDITNHIHLERHTLKNALSDNGSTSVFLTPVYDLESDILNDDSITLFEYQHCNGGEQGCNRYPETRRQYVITIHRSLAFSYIVGLYVHYIPLFEIVGRGIDHFFEIGQINPA